MDVYLFLVAVSTIWGVAVGGITTQVTKEDDDMCKSGDSACGSTPQCSAMKCFGWLYSSYDPRIIFAI